MNKASSAAALWSMLVALLCLLHNTIISPSPHKDAYLHMTDSTTPESRQDIRKHSSKRPLPSSPARLSNVKPKQYHFFEKKNLPM